MKPTTILPAIIAALVIIQPALAEDDTELAKKLTNPVADLISVPIRANMDFGLGAGGGHRITTNIQPVHATTSSARTRVRSGDSGRDSRCCFRRAS